ncbi:MOSC domain-containing protein [Clostridium sp. BL-8]|uniref:MOSC domain-containing protein n=1 Tax=Clostridium sp. BL-8 TaxID=349938 RepID=UPI00098CB095|nr:MOSC domain-containing protein [Clostridium sp. BL-8]OOM73552.1 MOSC domain protein [Clostridium sp. BL-8]
MGKVIAVCISEKRGTQKTNIKEANFIENFGIEKDAHAGDWHRQVSLLSYEKIDEFNKKGANVIDGAFGENLVVEGIKFTELPVGTKLQCNDVILEMTQIGKECHSHCEIYKKMGECIMPTNGVFAKVIKGGKIKCGDEMMVIV